MTKYYILMSDFFCVYCDCLILHRFKFSSQAIMITNTSPIQCVFTDRLASENLNSIVFIFVFHSKSMMNASKQEHAKTEKLKIEHVYGKKYRVVCVAQTLLKTVYTRGIDNKHWSGGGGLYQFSN